MNRDKRWKRFVSTYVGGLAITSLLVGCTSPEAGNRAASDDATLTVAWPRDIGEMNPHVYNPSQLFAQSMVFEPLVRYGENGELEPHLATSWDISEDGLTYTFQLRDDVTFSDGSPFDADIVTKNFETVLANKDMHSWLGFITKVKSIEAVDVHTVQLTLTEPYYPTIQELAVVRPVRFLGEAGFPENGDTSKGVEASIGTGPWVLESYKPDESATFKRNENYWGELPDVEEVEVKIIPDAETRVLAFEKGDIDLIYGEGAISIDAFNQLAATDQYATAVSEPVATRLLVMNTKNEKLADERVRKALHHAFNKEVMVEGITSGLEETADHILPTNLPYTSDIEVESIRYDVKEAKRLLDEAGWTLAKGKTVREKDGEPFRIEMMYDAAEMIQKGMAETLQSEWANIGVELKLVAVELPDQVQRFKDNRFDINMYSNFGAPYDPHTFVNIIGAEGFGFIEAISAYPNKEVLLKEMKDVLKTTDEAERQAAYREILPSLQNQGALVPISYLKKTAIYQEDVSNFSFSPNRDEHPFMTIDLK